MSAQDVVNLQLMKQRSRHEAFDKIVDACYKKIENCVKVLRNTTDIYYDVPEFLIGYPLYDLNECITYVKNVIEGKGFQVRYTFPRVLNVSWKPLPVPIKYGRPLNTISNAKSSFMQTSGQRTITTSASPTSPSSAARAKKKPSGKFILDLT